VQNVRLLLLAVFSFRIGPIQLRTPYASHGNYPPYYSWLSASHHQWVLTILVANQERSVSL